MATNYCVEAVIAEIKKALPDNATEAQRKGVASMVADIADYVDAATEGRPSKGTPVFLEGPYWADPEFVADLVKKIKNGYDYKAKINQKTVVKSAIAAVELRQRAVGLTLELNPKLRDELASINSKLAETPDDAKLLSRKEEVNQELEASFPEAIEAIMVGSTKKGTGLRQSVDARSQGVEAQLVGPLVAELRKNGLLDIVRSGDMDKDIARELWEAGSSGNKNAKLAADIIRKQQDLSVAQKNRQGAWIKKLKGYIVRHSHDLEKIRKEGPDKWIEAVIDKIDWYRTAPQALNNEAEKVKILTQIYKEISNGAHLLNASDTFDDVLVGISSGLADKLSRHRGIHFKSADDWLDYNAKFGGENLLNAVVNNLKKSADNIALMEAFGPNPREVLDQTFKYLDERATKNSFLKKKWQGRQRTSLINKMNELDGTSRIPIDNGIAKFGRFVRIWNNLSSLGSAQISALADIPFFASANTSMADNMFEGLFGGYATALTNLFRGRGSGETRELADLIGVGIEGMLGDILQRFSPHDYSYGMWSKAQKLLFDLQGLTWWTDVHKTGAGLMMARDLANKAELNWSKLNDNMKLTLKTYNIDEAKWDLIRKNTLVEVEGKTFVSPAKVKDIKGLSTEARQDLEIDLRSMLMDRSTFFVPTPTAKERAAATLGTQPGTIVGEATRFLMQFKSFPLTIGRIVGSVGRGPSAVSGIAHIMIMGTVFGYLSLTLKDLVKGRMPREKEDIKDWSKIGLASFIQGGGVGIYGDLLFAMESRYGSNVFVTLGGPALGFGGDAWKMFGDTVMLGAGAVGLSKEKDLDSYAYTNISRIKNHMPFQNLMWSRFATDAAFYAAMNEWVKPGHRAKIRRKIEREYKQETLF